MKVVSAVNVFIREGVGVVVPLARICGRAYVAKRPAIKLERVSSSTLTSAISTCLAQFEERKSPPLGQFTNIAKEALGIEEDADFYEGVKRYLVEITVTFRQLCGTAVAVA